MWAQRLGSSFFFGSYVLVFGLGIVALFGFAIFKQFGNSDSVAMEKSVGEVNSKEGAILFSPAEAAYQACLPCHGVNAEGSDRMGAPALNRQHSDYLRRQIAKFVEGKRGTHPEDQQGAEMHRISLAIEESESIDLVLKYIESLSADLPSRSFEGDVVKGGSSYMLCIACHGADGQGRRDLKAPALVGLQDWYIVKMLMKFKQGLRGYDATDYEGLLMRPWAMGISDEQEMMNIASYIYTLASEYE